MKLLILESDRSLRLALGRERRWTDHEIVLVDAVPSAVAQLCRLSFDAVSIDLRSPRFRGLALIEMLRSRTETLPIVATAVSPSEDELESLASLNAKFMPKPYELQALIELCESDVPAPSPVRASSVEPPSVDTATQALRPQLRMIARKALNEGQFPTLDMRAMDIQRLMSEDDCSIGALVELLEDDAHVTASVLRRANTAAHRCAGDFTTLRDACIRIGTRDTFAIALHTLMASAFPVRREPYRSLLERQWRVARTTATLARHIGREKSVGNADELFVAGLMSNVGALFAVWLLSEHHHLLHHRDANFIAAEVDAMESKLGTTLRERWALPERLVWLCDFSRVDELSSLRAMLATSIQLARELEDAGKNWDSEESEALEALGALTFNREQQLQIVQAARSMTTAA